MPTAAVGLAWPDGVRYLTRRQPAVGIEGTCCSVADRPSRPQVVCVCLMEYCVLRWRCGE
jgi:hypothetical protein